MDCLHDLIQRLYVVGVYSDARSPWSQELADVLWLARFLPRGERESMGTTRPQYPSPAGQLDDEDSDAGAAGKSGGGASPTQARRYPPPGLSRRGLAENQEVDLHVSEGRGIRRPSALSLPTTGGDLAQHLSEVGLRVGRPGMLPDPLELGRKLRPLLQRVPSRTRRIVDEAATVDNLAERRLPVPVLRGVAERRWELAVVIDNHPSTVLWQPLLAELIELFGHHGAFRDLRLWRLDTTARGPVRLWPGVSGGTPRSPSALTDPLGRRVVLVFSDFSARGWRLGPSAARHPGASLPPAPLDAVADWQRTQPVVLLHLMAREHWQRTGFASADLCTLSVATGDVLRMHGAPRLHLDGGGPDRTAPNRTDWTLTLPVIGIGAEDLSAWASMLSGRAGAELAAVRFTPDHRPDSAGSEAVRVRPISAESTPTERLRRFMAGASEPARELAQACAGMPLTLPVVRLVQEAAGIDRNPAYLAELFLGGLLRPIHEQPLADPSPLQCIYDFPSGVRQLLIDTTKPARLRDLLPRVARLIEQRVGSTRDFLARYLDLSHPLHDGDAATFGEPLFEPFARIRLQVLRRLGGWYADEAARLAATLDREAVPQQADILVLVETAGSFQALLETYRARFGRIPDSFIAEAYHGWDMGNLLGSDIVLVPVLPLAGTQMGVTIRRLLEALQPKVVLLLGREDYAYDPSGSEGPLVAIVTAHFTASAPSPDAVQIDTHRTAPWVTRWVSLARELEPWPKRAHFVSIGALAKVKGSGVRPESVSSAVDDPQEASAAGRVFIDARGACEAADIPWVMIQGSIEGMSEWSGGDPMSHRRSAVETQAAFVLDLLQQVPLGPHAFRDAAEGPEMVWLPGAPLAMGSPDGVGDEDEHPAQEVTLSHYAVGKYPVTVGEFRRFVEATGYRTEAGTGDGAYVGFNVLRKVKDASWRNPYMDQDDRHPVVCISWNDANAYCAWLSRAIGQPYALLTEAQWEHACRGGTETQWCCGDDEAALKDYAWYGARAEDGTHAVGLKRANPFGLYDLHGNVWEWCADCYASDTYEQRASSAEGDVKPSEESTGAIAVSTSVDPGRPGADSDRVVRGGSWNDVADRCRSAYRDYRHPSDQFFYLGFRLSRTGPLSSYPFALGRCEWLSEPKPIPAFLPNLRDSLADGGRGPAMVWLRGGDFTMGQNDSPYDDEKPAHWVRVSAFSIGQYPLTFNEYDRFCTVNGCDKPDDHGWGRGRRPVINISWHDAQAYCDWLNVQQEIGTYRVLTEAEWEFACRAGTDTKWICGDDEAQLGHHAWYRENSENRTHPVGEKQPNAWQLHDMHGNVWEWCADWWAEGTYARRAASSSPSEDPSGPSTISNRVMRGGAWDYIADNCRSAYRSCRLSSYRYRNLGFRLARIGSWPSYSFTLGNGKETPATQHVKPERADKAETDAPELFQP